MYILKTEDRGTDRLIYWTIDGEHIFKIDRIPIRVNRKGDNNRDPRNFK